MISVLSEEVATGNGSSMLLESTSNRGSVLLQEIQVM